MTGHTVVIGCRNFEREAPLSLSLSLLLSLFRSLSLPRSLVGETSECPGGYYYDRGRDRERATSFSVIRSARILRC